MTPPGGRKSPDGAPRTAKVMTRMTERDKVLLDAVGGRQGANQLILKAMRVVLRAFAKDYDSAHVQVG